MGFAPVGMNATRPVDVLAVMDEFGEDYRTYIPQFHAQNRKRMKRTVADFDQARRAVAELIEAAKQYLHAELMQDLIAAEDRLDAALARCQP